MNILIIDNSPTLSHIMKKTLEAYNYRITLDGDCFVTKNLVREGTFDIVILNTSLPKEKSFSILNSVKKISPHIKTLGICKKEGWKNRVRFLQNGADDVLTYPFPMQELLARIQCLNRRPKNYDLDKLYLSDIEVNTNIRSTTQGGVEIPLRKQEYSLFEYLLRNKNRTVTRYELMDHVWDYRKFNNSNTIDVHVKRLRDKLGNRNLIQTVHGVGYRIIEKKPRAS